MSTVNRFYPINVQGTNAITGTYNSVCLLANSNTELSGNTYTKALAIGCDISAGHVLTLSGDTLMAGRTDVSGTLYVNGVSVTGGGNQTLASVLSYGSNTGGYDINMDMAMLNDAKIVDISNQGGLIQITNWDVSEPAYSTDGLYQLYTGSGYYTDISGWGFVGSGLVDTYTVGIQKGTNSSTGDNIVYYPFSVDQAISVHVPQNNSMFAYSINYTLGKGQYVASIHLYCNDTGGGGAVLDFLAMNNTTQISLAELHGVNPVGQGWVKYRISFALAETTEVYFSLYLNATTYTGGTYVDITGLQVYKTTGLIVRSNAGASVIGSKTSHLNSLWVTEGLNIETGNLTTQTGIYPGTQYGRYNVAVNTAYGGVSTNNVACIGIGKDAMLGSTASVNAIAIGTNAGLTMNGTTDCVFIGSGADVNTGVGNVMNSVAIGKNSKIDVSNCIYLGTHAETVKISGDLSGVTTINGVTYTPGGTGGAGSLAETLTIGNQANMMIDMSQNDLSNCSMIYTNGLDVSGNAKFNNLKYLGVVADIPITRGNFDSPAYPAGNNLLYSGVATYTGYTGWTFSTAGSAYSVYILTGAFKTPYYVTYFTSGNQCLVLVPGTPMTAKTSTYALMSGQYVFSFWVQAQSYGTPPSLTASVKTSTATLITISGIDPTTSYPTWIQYKMPFIIDVDNTGVFFEFKNASAYICLDTLTLTLDKCMIASDGVKTSTVGGSQSMLNSVYIAGGMSVTSGGANIVGGIQTGTTYGGNNLAINSIMGEAVGSTNKNTIAMGAGTLQSATTVENTVAIGNGINAGSLGGSNNVIMGYGSNTADASSNVVMGYRAGCKGDANIVIGSLAGRVQDGGVLISNNVAIGTQVFQRYNGFSSLNGCELNTAVGAYSQYNNADKYNVSVGAFSLYNMAGSAGVTANGNNGFYCQKNTALGHYAGYTHQKYNNCLFLGGYADASVNDLWNATAIGYGCKVDASNCIQIGSNGEKVQISGDLANVTTINGAPYAPSSQTLAQTLTQGNVANMAIDLSNNPLNNVSAINMMPTNGNINNVNTLTLASTGTKQIAGNGGSIIGMLSVSAELFNQSQVNVTTPDVKLENINVSATTGVRMRTMKKRPAAGLSANDTLYTMETYGTNSANTEVQYGADEIDASVTTAGVHGGTRMISLARGGVMTNVLKLDQNITAYEPIILSAVGLRNAYMNINLTANASYITTWENYIGNHVFVTQTTPGWQLTIGAAQTYPGAICTIENSSNFNLTITTTTGNGAFVDIYGNGTVTTILYSGQTIKFVSNGTNWALNGLTGVPMTVRYVNTAAQALGTAAAALVFPTLETTTISDTAGIRTWSATILGYSGGTWTNNSLMPMTLLVQFVGNTASTANHRFVGVNYLNTTRNPYIRPMWVNNAAGGTATMSITQIVHLGIGDSFNILGQVYVTATTFLANANVTITRLG